MQRLKSVGKKSMARRIMFFLMITSVIGLCGCATTTVTPPKEEQSRPLVFGLGGLKYVMNLKVYSDPEKDLFIYKTYAFDYTNKENPLLEKELFKMLEPIFTNKGLKKAKENPDILITMNFYTGKKEKYTPPQTITTTQIKQVWESGMIGWTSTGRYVAVPITQSETIPGSTEISYYRNIRLNFFDYPTLTSGKKLEIPPFVWVGEVDSEGSFSDIRAVAPVMLEELIENFPSKSGAGIEMKRSCTVYKYGTTGIKGKGYTKGGGTFVVRPICWFFIITGIEPGSQAETAGLHEGDRILKINGKEVYIAVHTIKGDLLYEAISPPPTYMGYPRTGEIEIEVRSPRSKTTQKVRLTPQEVVTKEYR